MVIDIDSFLDDFDDKELDKKKEKPKKEVDLKFKDYLADKFAQMEDIVNQEDFEFLVKAYSEIKKFEEELPNKFFDVKKTSGQSMSRVGSKFTETFLNGVKANKKFYGNKVNEFVVKVEECLKNKEILKAVSLFNEVTKNYKNFPKEFIFEKIDLGKKVRELEVKINEEFFVVWDEELKEIKKKIQKEVLNLKKNLQPGNIQEVEESLAIINEIFEKSPKVFYKELLKERIAVSKIIIVAETFLKKQYERDFKEKKIMFNDLLERFHSFQIKKKVNDALLVYDELVVLFERMPDMYIKEKVEIYKKINSVFDQLNSMLLVSNVDRFISTYRDSKVIMQAKEYISHAKINPKFDLKNLLAVKKNLDKVSEQLRPEKVELEREIKSILSSFRVKQKALENKNNVLAKDSLKKKKSKPEINLEVKVSGDEILKKEESIENLKQVDLKLKKKVPVENSLPSMNDNVLVLNEFLTGKKDNVSLNMVEEINKNYQKVLSEENIDLKRQLLKKIKFYVSLINLKEERKKIIEEKLKSCE